MLQEKTNRYEKQIDYNPKLYHSHRNTYLQQWPRFITPKPNPLRRTWHSAQSIGIAMFNNIFSEMNIKNVIHWGGDARGNGGTILISSCKCNYSIYLDIQVYYLQYPLFYAFNWFLMCNYTCFYNTCLYRPLPWKVMFLVTSKPTSPSFQPTGIRLGLLWRGNRCVLPIISEYQ